MHCLQETLVNILFYFVCLILMPEQQITGASAVNRLMRFERKHDKVLVVNASHIHHIINKQANT